MPQSLHMGTSTSHLSLCLCISPCRRHPAQVCLGSPIWPPSYCLSQQPGPLGICCPCQRQCKGWDPPSWSYSSATECPPARPVPVACGRQHAWGPAPAPWDGTRSRASTPSLHPAVIEAPSAGCWEEDEEGRSASLQGCSQGWPEAARSCLSTLTRGQRG